MAESWDTATLPAKDQLGHWAEVVCQAFTPLRVSQSTRGWVRAAEQAGFAGRVRTQRLASTNCADIASCTQNLDHGPTEVKRSPIDAVFVNLQLSGRCIGVQDGRRAVIPSGSFAVYDTTRPYSLTFEAADAATPWRALSFRVPRAQLIDLLGTETAAGGYALDGRSGPGAVAAEMMLSLWSANDALTPQARSAFDATFTHVLATALGAFDLPEDHDRAGVDAALRAAVLRFIDQRLPYGAVRAEEAAAHVGVSVRKLHGLFEATDTTFGATARAERLRRCASDLTDPHTTASVTEISHRWGFCDASHLSRAFKAAYGCSPSEYRAAFTGRAHP